MPRFALAQGIFTLALYFIQLQLNTGFRVKQVSEDRPWKIPDMKNGPWLEGLKHMESMMGIPENNTKAVRPFECAAFDLDNYAPPNEDVCYVRMYWCSSWFGIYHNADPTNRNTGDIIWGMRDAENHNCGTYGGYLHVYRVEVAKPAMIYGRGRYSMCNQQDCKQVAEISTGKLRPTWFGWNIKPSNDMGSDSQEPINYARWFALPEAAKGPVDASRTYDLLEHGFTDKNKNGKFQWRPVCQETIIDRKKCLGSLGLDMENMDRSSPTSEEDIAAFLNAGAVGMPKKHATDACKDVTRYAFSRVPRCPDSEK